MKRVIAWGFLFVGFAFGIVWYFDVNQAGESWSDVLSDPWGTIQDLFSKGAAIVQSKVSSDPRVIATGLIAQFEGFVGHAYRDAVGVLTIGYGHKIVAGDGFGEGSTVSQSDAFALLQTDLDVYATCVDNAVESDLTPKQLAALYSFTYNEGCAAFKSSTLLEKINTGDLSGAVDEFARWNMAGGQVLQALVSRRQDESDLFSSDISA